MHYGGLVGQYKLLEKLGQGAFGEVWKAEHVELGTLRAIKVPRSPDIAARLKEEGRIAAKLEAAELWDGRSRESVSPQTAETSP